MINEVLSKGKKNTITGKELADILHCDIRTVTAIIEKERREGQPICATATGDNKGYYLAEDRAELEAYCKTLKQRESQLYVTRVALIDTLRKLPKRAK